MKPSTIVFVLFTVLVTVGQNKPKKKAQPAPAPSSEPSLQETTDWIHDFVENHPRIYVHKYDSHYKMSLPYRTYSLETRFDGCGVEVIITSKLLKPAVQQRWRDVFSLKDVNHVTVDPTTKDVGVITDEFLVKLETNEQVHNSSWTDEKPDKTNELQNSAELVFASREDAERVAKAFRHATELCGGKLSAF